MLVIIIKIMTNIYNVLTYYQAINKNKVYLDIGSNIGSTVSFAAKMNNITIHAFEPHPKYYKYLKSQSFLNKIESFLKRKNTKIIVNNFALSNKSGPIKFYLHDKNIGGHSIIKEKVLLTGSSKQIEILSNCKTLDELNIQNISLIKIDVEGAEHLVLEGGKKTINKFKPLILTEFRGKNAPKKIRNIEKIKNLMKELNYEFYLDDKNFKNKFEKSVGDILFYPKNNLNFNPNKFSIKLNSNFSIKEKFIRIFKRILKFEISRLHHILIRNDLTLD